MARIPQSKSLPDAGRRTEDFRFRTGHRRVFARRTSNRRSNGSNGVATCSLRVKIPHPCHWRRGQIDNGSFGRSTRGRRVRSDVDTRFDEDSCTPCRAGRSNSGGGVRWARSVTASFVGLLIVVDIVQSTSFRSVGTGTANSSNCIDMHELSCGRSGGREHQMRIEASCSRWKPP